MHAQQKYSTNKTEEVQTENLPQYSKKLVRNSKCITAPIGSKIQAFIPVGDKTHSAIHFYISVIKLNLVFIKKTFCQLCLQQSVPGGVLCVLCVAVHTKGTEE